MRVHPSAAAAVLFLAVVAQAQTPTSRPADTDPALWDRLVAIDRLGSTIADLSADFEQRKVTPLLRKPLTSTGTIRVKGDAMLWDTKAPEPTRMRIDAQEIRLYYPRQKTLEIYPVDRRLGSLAASPLPRLAVLARYFSFAEAAITTLGEDVQPDDRLALRLTPIDANLREHLEQVVVLLDIRRGLILRAEMTDADGDRTRLVFSNIKVNTGLSDADVRLEVPESVKVTRPLEGLGGSSAPPPSRVRERGGK